MNNLALLELECPRCLGGKVPFVNGCNLCYGSGKVPTEEGYKILTMIKNNLPLFRDQLKEMLEG